MKKSKVQMKNRHGSSFIGPVFKEMQLIHFQWSFSDSRFSHKQESYFILQQILSILRGLLCLHFWGQNFSPTKWLRPEFCLWGLLVRQLWWWL